MISCFFGLNWSCICTNVGNKTAAFSDILIHAIWLEKEGRFNSRQEKFHHISPLSFFLLRWHGDTKLLPDSRLLRSRFWHGTSKKSKQNNIKTKRTIRKSCKKCCSCGRRREKFGGGGGTATARGGLAHTHSSQDGRIAYRVTRRNFSFGDKEFGVTLPLFKCLPRTTLTAIFRHTGLLYGIYKRLREAKWELQAGDDDEVTCKIIK